MRKKTLSLLLLLSLLSAAVMPVAAAAESADSTTLVYMCSIDRMIAAPLWRSVKKSFTEAKALKADYFLIHMNTYGGQVDFADSIRTIILNSDIPVMVFIDNQAISAGALISIACDSIYIRPGGSIGAATVVNQGGEKMPDKYQSFMRGMMRATAEAHGKKAVVTNGDTVWVWHRDPEIAQAMVDPSIVIKGIVDTGQVLTLTALEAIKYGYCEGEASSVREVLEKAGIDGYKLTELKLTATERIIQFLVNPVVSGILIMLIIGGIYFELQSPGIGFPIIAAITAALLYFAPMYLEGVAENWHIIVFVAGIILILVEIFAIPGFGVTGILGIICIVTGLTFAMIDKIVFRFGPTPGGIREVVVSFAIVLLSIFASFILSLWMTKKLFSPNRLFGSLALETTQKKSEGYVSFDTERQRSLVGRTGVAHTILRPSGKVIINDEVYPAVAETGYIEKGDRILVRKEEQGQLYVIKE